MASMPSGVFLVAFSVTRASHDHPRRQLAVNSIQLSRGLATMISLPTRKALWSKAHDVCAFPGCTQTLVLVGDEAGDVPDPSVVGQEAHIRSARPDGPRFDPSYPKAKLDEYENLLLLCATHHTLVDSRNGAGFSVGALVRMKRDHERFQDRNQQLEQTLRAYAGARYDIDDQILFQQVDLHVPSVEQMFVDVPIGCARGSALASLFTRIAREHPGDADPIDLAGGMVVVGGAQALLHPDWTGNAIVVAGPGQGKSTLLKYVCQFHRARQLDRPTYSNDEPDLTRAGAVNRFAIRIDLRDYAAWAFSALRRAKKKAAKPLRKSEAGQDEGLPTLEEFIIEDIRENIGTLSFTKEDFAALVAARALLFAFDGLDEVANLDQRAAVSSEITGMYRRLRPNAANLSVLVATRPGGSLSALASNRDFPVLNLRGLTPGLRLQYLERWADISELSASAATKLRKLFQGNIHRPHVRELASSPMQLAILLHLLHRRQLLPQQRTELYRDYLKTFLDREQADDKEPLLLEQRRVIEDVLAYLGWYLQSKAEEGKEDSDGSITHAQLRALLTQHLSGHTKAHKIAEQVFLSFTTRVLCLIELHTGKYTFEVQSLREYFAAVYIFDNSPSRGTGNTKDDCFDALIQRPYWSNVARFFAGMFSRGEVRAVRDNLSIANNAVEPHPMARAIAAQLLEDRVYDGMADKDIQEVVDFVLDGPGVVFADRGLLDSGGARLILGEQAGREQAVHHLKQRLTPPTETGTSAIVARLLYQHARTEDQISNWWWDRVERTRTWLESAAALRGFSNVDADREGELFSVLTAAESDAGWRVPLLVRGQYMSRSPQILGLAKAELNDGASSATGTTRQPGPVADMVRAAHALETRWSDVLPVRFHSTRSEGEAEEAFAQLTGSAHYKNVYRDPSDFGSWTSWIAAVADSWGDGWVLHRAIAGLPPALAITDILMRLPEGSIAGGALRLERDFRERRGDAEWWQSALNRASSSLAKRDWLIGLLSHAHSAVVLSLTTSVQSVVENLSPKHYWSVVLALRSSEAAKHNRRLNVDAAARAHAIQLSASALWLLRCVSTENSRDRIDRYLVSGATEIMRLRPENPDVRLDVATGGQLVERFRGLSDDVYDIRWPGGSTIPKNLATDVLASPSEWPGAVVQLAADQRAQDLAKRTKPLLTLAQESGWFPRS